MLKHLNSFPTAPVIEAENLKLIQLKTLCPDHVHRILESLLPYLESTYGSAYVKTLLKSNELSNLVAKTEQISDVSAQCIWLIAEP